MPKVSKMALSKLIGSVIEANQKIAKYYHDDHEQKCAAISVSEEATAVVSLPSEIWRIIFGHVADFTDLVRIQKTCGLFRDILHPRQTSFLFNEVFPIVQPSLNGLEVMRCRLVSTTWKVVINANIERFLASEPGELSPQQWVWSKRLKTFVRRLEDVYSFRNTAQEYTKPLEFMQRMEDQPTNPFIGSWLGIEVSTRSMNRVLRDIMANNRPGIAEREQIFWYHLKLLVMRFGKYLKSISIQITNDSVYADVEDLSRFLYSVIPECISNVKVIRYSGFLPASLSEFTSSSIDRLPVLSTCEMVIESLERPNNGLSIAWFRREFLHMNSTLLASTIKRLLQTITFWQDWELYTLEWLNLLELDIVELELEGIRTEAFTDTSLPNLESIAFVPSAEHRWSAGITFGQVIAILSGLGKQLHTVRVCNGFPLHELQGVGFAPANIKCVEFEETVDLNHVGLSRYEFLLHFPQLEKLQLVLSSVYDHEEEEGALNAANSNNNNNHEFDSAVDIFDLDRAVRGQISVYKARVWLLLPRLKLFMINSTVYRRRL